MLVPFIQAFRDPQSRRFQGLIDGRWRKAQTDALAMWRITAPLTQQALLFREREHEEMVRNITKRIEPLAKLCDELSLLVLVSI